MPLVNHKLFQRGTLEIKRKSKEHLASSPTVSSEDRLESTQENGLIITSRKDRRKGLQGNEQKGRNQTTQVLHSEDRDNAESIDLSDLETSATTEPVALEVLEPESWIERLTVSATFPIPLSQEHIDDDAIREQNFISHATLSLEEAIRQLEHRSIPWKRPTNYYAEMLKSDVHMAKIREELDRSESTIRRRAQRREQAHQKKFAREVKSEHSKKENDRKRKLTIAVETAKLRARKREKEDPTTTHSTLFGALGKRGRQMHTSDVDYEEENYYEAKDTKRQRNGSSHKGNRKGSSTPGAGKPKGAFSKGRGSKRPGKDTRKQRQ